MKLTEVLSFLCASHLLAFHAADPNTLLASTPTEIPTDPTLKPTPIPATKSTWTDDDQRDWILANQKGVEPGGISFCDQEWRPLTIHVGYPVVFGCFGNDVLWLSYQVHVQEVHRGDMTALNDHFAVVVTAGDECNHPAATVHDAPTQADCHNFEEMQAVKGEMCVRRDIAVNTMGSNQTCLIVYCTNHQSDCELWARSFWKKCW